MKLLYGRLHDVHLHVILAGVVVAHHRPGACHQDQEDALDHVSGQVVQHDVWLSGKQAV